MKSPEIGDLQALFDEKHFIQNEERPSRYWIPIIATYSGMRMEEIAQLTRSDLQVIDGVTLLGHSAGGITYTRYGKGYEIDKLAEVIQLSTYPDLDISPWRSQVEL